MFIITFENKNQKTRIMVEINIKPNIFEILAYYIYAYPSV